MGWVCVRVSGASDVLDVLIQRSIISDQRSAVSGQRAQGYRRRRKEKEKKLVVVSENKAAVCPVVSKTT